MTSMFGKLDRPAPPALTPADFPVGTPVWVRADIRCAAGVVMPYRLQDDRAGVRVRILPIHDEVYGDDMEGVVSPLRLRRREGP